MLSSKHQFCFLLCLAVMMGRGSSQATDCERERGRHCHKWAQCERRQGDQKPRCYCSPGFDGDGYNCNKNNQNERSTDCERERGRHCHKWAQCERRQGDQRPRCYCSPGFGGDGYNCHRDDHQQSQGQHGGGSCPQPNNIEHGSFTLTDGSRRPGTTASYRCQDGYRLQGSSQRTCQQSNQWSGSQPRCELLACEGRCQRPQNLDGGTMTVSGGCKVGNRVSYKCNSGFMLVGSTERTCRGDGRWSGTHPRCEKSTDCEREQGRHCHQWAQCERRQGDPKPRCYCSPGYMGDGYNCHDQRQDECQKRNHQTCHKHADCVRISDMKHVCKCRDGYKGDGVYCEGKGCNRPPGLTNGRLLANQQVFVRGNVITYQCDTGYVLTGDEQRTCQDDGRWSGNEPRCEQVQSQPKTCQRPQEIQHGTMTASDWSFPPGSTASYKCRGQYRIDGNSQRTCQHNGKWSGSKPECRKGRRQGRKCQRPQDIPNGTLRISDGSYKPKSVVTYECQHSYRLVGNSERTCLGNGAWTGSTPRCEDPNEGKLEIKCQRPPEHLPHGTATLSDHQLRPGSVVTYTCEKGWRIRGNTQRTCQNDGRWSGSHPACERERAPQDQCFGSCHANAECKVDKGQGRCKCRPPFFGDGYYCRGCDGGQTYRDCVTKCPPTCENPQPKCDRGCDPQNKCVCPEGKVQRSEHDKTCVNLNQC